MHRRISSLWIQRRQSRTELPSYCQHQAHARISVFGAPPPLYTLDHPDSCEPITSASPSQPKPAVAPRDDVSPLLSAFQLRDNQNRLAATLVLSSTCNSRGTPIAHPGEFIRGYVIVHREHSRRDVRSVLLVLSGRVTSPRSIQGPPAERTQKATSFLHERVELWDSSTQISPYYRLGDDLGTTPWDLNLPFEILLPQGIYLEGLQQTPPSFDNGAVASIEYQLDLEVNVGIFRRSERLVAPLNVHSIADVESPSPLRIAAYQAIPPRLSPDPDEDPEGWTVLPQVKFRGVCFKRLIVDLDCVLAIANPLVFQPGDIIPVQLTIWQGESSDSDDAQARVLNLLSKNEAISICLTRTISFVSGKAKKCKSSHSKSVETGSLTTARSMGICWASNSRSEYSEARVMNCEIQVPMDVTPSFEFQDIKVEYAVALAPFTATGLTHSYESELISSVVEIVGRRANFGAIQTKGFAPAGLVPPKTTKLKGWMSSEDVDVATLMSLHSLVSGHNSI